MVLILADLLQYMHAYDGSFRPLTGIMVLISMEKEYE